MKISFFLVVLMMLVSCNSLKVDIKVPEGAKVYSYHGYDHVDPYYWLEQRSEDGVPAPKIQTIIAAENQKSNDFFTEHETLLNQIYSEIRTRRKVVKKTEFIEQDDVFVYTSETREGEVYPVRYATNKKTKKQIVLLDEAERAKGFAYYSVSKLQVSPEKNRMVWVEDTVGDRHGHLYVKEIATDEIIFSVPDVSASLSWGKDENAFYYTKLDADSRAFQVRYVDLVNKSDIEVFTETDIAYLAYVKRSLSGKAAVVGSTNWDNDETSVIWFNGEPDNVQIIASRDLLLSMSLEHSQGKFFMRHRKVGEPYKISTFLSSFEDATLFYQSEFGSILSVQYFKDYVVLAERENGVDKLIKYRFKEGSFTEIDLDLDIYGVSFYNQVQSPETNTLRVRYESHLLPRTVIDVDLDDDSRTILSAREAVGFNKEDYVAKIVQVKSHDGVMVPATIIRGIDLVDKGPQPVYQYVYGGYGIGIPPEFPSSAFSLIDRGFTYVVSHVRGGDEMGISWHDDGRLMNRKNSFQDFEAISNYLVDNGYTTKGNISVTGESAGGIITAVALNNQPGLYKSISILVPAFEILNKVLNPELFISKIEWSEIGNPIESKKHFDYIKSYSPMQNLKNQEYPSFYVTGAIQDKIVGYYEPLKWTIAIREHDTVESTSLLHIREGAHIASGDGAVAMEFAKQMTFLALMHNRESLLEDRIYTGL
jgi:oligopeptidase B